MPKKKSTQAHKSTFETMRQADVPQSRNGKHRRIVTTILADVTDLAPGDAIRIPFKSLDDTKENVRAALSREGKKRNLPLATSADDGHLYVWLKERP